MTFDAILQKLKANLNYVLCAFLGLFHFVMMAFTYVSFFYKEYGENGYTLMNFSEYESYDAGALAVINGILQIFLIVVAVALLAVGVMGLLKAFGVFKQFPVEVGEYETKKLAGFGLCGYTAISFLLFILMLIWAGVNIDIRVGFGMYFALLFSGLLAAAPYVLPKCVPSMSEESVDGPQTIYRCQKCGKKAGKNEKFCSVCGGAVQAELINQYNYVCSGCGRSADKNEKFCSVCGGAVVAEVVKQYNYVCSGCGKKMKKTDKFCSVCGGAMVAVEVKYMEYICGNCGKKMKKTDKFCNVCGGAVVEREIAHASDTV